MKSQTLHLQKVKKTVTASKVELKTEKKELDGSLRFITTSVQGMKHWAQYTNRVTLIFEVFGECCSWTSDSFYTEYSFMLSPLLCRSASPLCRK